MPLPLLFVEVNHVNERSKLLSFQEPNARADLAHNLFLPTLLFVCLGAMAWAVRGCSGFGGMDGCIFAGVTWGTAWWFIAQQPDSRPLRPYRSAWIVLALTIGIGFSGNRGWMQWPSFFEGHLQTNYAEGKFVAIPRVYGFAWLFIAGVPWAGLGACVLAWCGAHRAAPSRDWGLRIGCGLGLAAVARLLFDHYPEFFLPLYNSLHSQYLDPQANPNLRRLINDNRAAVTHLGLYMGFLAAEIIRRDRRNIILISTVGLVNGLGWAVWQNWKWAPKLWPHVNFNWWRCWESSAGISIGLAYGLAYYLANRPMSAEEMSSSSTQRIDANFERLGLGLGLVLGLGLSLKNGLKGWANIYLGNENHWNHVLWLFFGPVMVLSFVVLLVRFWRGTASSESKSDVGPEAYRLMWLVLLTQNIIAQIITGPLSAWNEVAFSIYYVLLFLITAVIVYHFQASRVSCGTTIDCH
jgi:hypothetical protein